MSRTDKKSKKALMHTLWAVLSCVAAVLCMAVIFYFSHQSGEASAEQSLTAMGPLMDFILKYIGHNAFRKIAHFLEYCALAFLIYNAEYACIKKPRFLPPLILSFLYSVSDEIHQYFIPGRACRVFDLCVDMGGILCGLAVFCVLIRIISRIKKKKAQLKK